jgi:BASS family bile acid:Na+ symporter
MGIVARAFEVLAWLGRQGTRAVAASIFIGLAIPPLSEYFKPLVAPSIFMMLTLAFLRVEPTAFRSQFTRDRLLTLGAATLWMMIATPLILGTAYTFFGSGDLWKELSLALVLQAAAPPITSAPAFVALLGLDIALALAVLVTATTLTPITAPFFANYFAGDALPLDPIALSVRLAFFLGGAFVVARLLRRLAGDTRIREWREHIDGLNVVGLFVFATALMGSVSTHALENPGLVLALLALSFFLFFALLGITALLFWQLGANRALAVGFSSSARNMGLMLAAASGVSDVVWLYIAVAQFPIYLAPQILSPLVSRILRWQLPPGQ